MTAAPEEKTVTAFDAARELLKEHGWGRGAYLHPDTGHYCLVGAVMRSVIGRIVPYGFMKDFERGALNQYERAIIATLAEMFPDQVAPDDGISVAMLWNDSDGVNETLVDLVLSKASEKLPRT